MLQNFFNIAKNGTSALQDPPAMMQGPKSPIIKPKKPQLVQVSDSNNVKAYITKDDLMNAPVRQAPSREKLVVEDVKAAFNASATQRWVHEREWIMSLAYAVGNHYLPWRDSGNYPDILFDPDDPERSFYYTNYLGTSVIKKLKSRLTTNKPDCSTRPWTSRQLDIDAAAEGRDLLEHYDSMFDRQVQNADLVQVALTTSTGFIKIWWDPFKKASTGYQDAYGQMQYDEAEVGDIEEMVCLPFEVYPDPQARYWSEVGWIIHAKRHPLEYFQKRYGNPDGSGPGWDVKAEAYSAATSLAGWWEQRLDQIYGEAYRTTAARYSEASATEYEKWELPTQRYPEGRIVRCSDSVLLDEGPWPVKSPTTNPMNKFPFVPFSFCNYAGTLWGMNTVRDNIPAQRNIDNIGSRLYDRIDAEKPMWFKPYGSGVTTDDLQQRQQFAIIEHDPMLMPTIVTPPAINDQWFKALEWYTHCMEDSTGIHEISKGEAAANITSGFQVQLLQEQDNTQLKEAHDNLERCQKWRGEWELAYAAQYYSEPRLVMLSQVSDPQQAAANVRAFTALTGGGKCLVHVQPGSSIMKSAAARQEWIMQLLTSGGFTPQMMPLLLVASKMMGLNQSDIREEQIMYALKLMQQMEAEQQQQAAQAQQQQMQAQQQGQMAMLQMETQAKLQLVTAQANIEMKTKIAMAQIESQANSAMEMHKTAADVAIEREKLQHKLIEIKAKAYEDFHATMQETIGKMFLQEHMASKPSVALTGQLGSQGLIGSEQLAGLPKLDNASEVLTRDKPKPLSMNVNNKQGYT